MAGIITGAIATALSVLVVVGVFYLLAKKQGFFSGPSETEQTTDERMAKESDPSHRRLGMADRMREQTPLVKLLSMTLIGFALFVGYNAYKFASTGSPQHMVYTSELQTLFSGTIIFAAGVWFTRRQDDKAGKIHMKYEDVEEDEGHAETIYYDKSKARRTKDGDVRVPVFSDQRLLGLFWRPKLVADDPERRHADERLPTDQIILEVPGDGSTAWHRHSEEAVVRAKDKEEQDDAVVDYRVVPSDRKSASEVQSMKNEMEEQEQELEQRQIEIAILTERILDLQAVAEQSDDKALDRLMEAGEGVADIFARVNQQMPNRSNGDAAEATSAIPGGDGGD